MTLRGAAGGIGVTLSYLSKIERGFVTPRPPMMRRILSFYGIPGDRTLEFFPGLAA